MQAVDAKGYIMNFLSSLAGEPALNLMIYHPIHDVWVYLLAAAVLQSLAAYSWRYRQNPAALYLALGLADKSLWLLAIVMITVSQALADKILWTIILNLDGIAVVPITLLVALHITEQKPALIRTVRSWLLLLTALAWLLVLTNGLHGWFWRDFLWDGTTFGLIRGPAFWVFLAACYSGMGTAMALLLHRAVKTSGLRRWQAIAVPANFAISIAGHARWVSTQSDLIPPLPVTFLLGGLVWFGIFFGLRVFNLQELAEATVTRDMNDCLIVADAQDYIVELNPAAEALLGTRAAALLGSQAATALAPWPALAVLAESREAQTGEITLAGGHYLFRVSLLTGWGGRSFGKAIVLQDIGALKKAQARIFEQEKALSILAERDRLGRELHDGPGQAWGYINMQVEAVRSLLAKNEPDRAETLLARLAAVTRDVHVDIRESITGLRAGAGQGLWHTLADYLQWFRHAAALDVELAVDQELAAWQPPPTAQAQLLRIVQEALTNVRKHAGARRVRVVARRQGDNAEISVADDGRGFDPAAAAGKGSYGLRIMEERAAEAGGRLWVESAPGAGAAVVVALPFTPSQAEE